MYGEAAPNEFEIVGVVANERVRGLERPGQPAFYLSTRQFPQTALTLLVRTAGDPLSSAADLRSAIRGVDDRITFDGATSLDAVLATQLIGRRVTTNVIGAFAATALLLAALGVYGLLTITVGTRTREIGVRLAIGASPRSVAWQVIADALKTATLGIAVGSALSIPATRFVEHLLVGVTRDDTLTLGTSAAVMLAVATAATLLPARRAAQIDPAITLRGAP